MKIVWVLPRLRCAGGVRIVVEYANRLKALGHEVVVACLEPSPNGAACFPVETALVEGDRIDEATRSADAVIATDYTTVQAVLQCQTGGRRYHFIQNRESLFAKHVWRARRVERHYALPLIPITIAHWLQAVLRLSGKESFVIHNGLDTEQFRQVPGLRPDCYRVLAEGHGSSSPWKRFEEGVQSARLAGADEVWALTLCEADVQVDRFLSNVSTEEVVRAYSSCHAVVKLSDFEGYPAPQAEAMACGCSVVTAKAPGTMEYCQDGVNSIVVLPWDVQAAADALRRLRDPAVRETLVEGGKRTISKMFQWPDKVAAMELALSGKVAAEDMECPFHTIEQQNEFIAASGPFTLPYWQMMNALGSSAPYGRGKLADRLARPLIALADRNSVLGRA